jgi:periplasmic protein TonB
VDDTVETSVAEKPRFQFRWGPFLIVALIHVVVIMGLIRAFSPKLVSDLTDSALATFSVSSPPKPPPPPPLPPQPDEAGEAAKVGKKAVPKEAKTPKPKLVIAAKSAPEAAASGSANTSGAGDSGSGTGAGGQGNGTGSGNAGNGQGGGAAKKPSVRSGELNQARDFPVPEGGRQTRFGKSVTVYFTVTAEGEARNCSVAKSEVDAATTAAVCPLVLRKIRFNPAQRADGTPMEARYGYRVDFKAQ